MKPAIFKHDFKSIAEMIADTLPSKWKPEYSKRHDDLYNVWRPVIEVHPTKCCDIYWEIVDVVSTEQEAKIAVQHLVKHGN